MGILLIEARADRAGDDVAHGKQQEHAVGSSNEEINNGASFKECKHW